MARTSQRLSGANTAHKRQASASTINGNGVKKARSNNVSKDEDDHDEEEIDDDETSETEEHSDFDDEDDTEESPSENEEDDEDEYDSEDEKPKSRRKSTSRKSLNSKPPKSAQRNDASNGDTPRADVWREGVSAGLGPGKQVIFKKPKARSAGNTPYRDDTLHPNTLLFLADLKKNNNRQWLKMNDPDFRQSEKDFYSFVEKVTEKLTEIDETVPELPVKDVIFRIYRDVRFSPDPTPYKAHFSVAFSRTGRKGPYAHYYLQIAPGDSSFVGAGIWHPEAEPLARLRQAIDRSSRGLKDVLSQDGIRKEFLKGAARNDAKVVKAFVAANSENALKTKPKGYDADHADISLLRLRNYTIGCKLSHDEVVGEGGLDRIAELFAIMEPFITYLNSIVMPDEAPDDEEEDDDDDEAEEEQEEERE